MTIPSTHSAAYTIPGLANHAAVSKSEITIGGATIRHLNQLDVNTIILCVCTYYKIKMDELLNKSRKRDILRQRQVCGYLLYRYSQSTLKSISSIFRQDHTTIINSNNVVSAQLSLRIDNEYKQDINNIRQLLFKR